MTPEATSRSGSCLCGAVKVRARCDAHIQACHCRQCQRWTGGGPLLSTRVEDAEITGDEAIRFYRASDWGERAFCGICGSTLFWRMQHGPVDYIAVGLLDDQSGLTAAEEIFTDYRPEWLPQWPGATQSTEANEMAKLKAHLAGETHDRI